MNRLISLYLLIIVLYAGLASAETSKHNIQSQCQSLGLSMKSYHAEHLTKRPADQAFAQRVSDIMLRAIDGQKALMLAPEASALKAEIERFTLNPKRSCTFFNQLLQRRLGWVTSMSAYVDQVLDDPKLKLDRALTVNIDSDKRDRPKNQREQDALRHMLIQWQLAIYVSSGETLEEAKRKLSKRYALNVRRMSEETFTDQYAQFLNSYAMAFDPHTSYFSAEMLEEFRISMKLSLEGIGATLQQRDGYTRVMDIVPGGAADRQGELKRKDKIIAVGQGTSGDVVDVVDMALSDVVRLIRGKKGTQVRLRIVREKRKRPLDITITRDKIDLKEQAATLKWETLKRGDRSLKLAILKLPSFYGGYGAARQSRDDVKRLLIQAERDGADGLLLDLSLNSGGLLSHAVDITGHFLRLGAVVGVRGNQNQDLRDQDPNIAWRGPLVVLTSRISASASEIVSGALSDYRRAVLVGDSRTFGKGTVQNVQNLGPGQGAMKFTVARFHRPSGQSTQNAGVKVDITLPSLTDRPIFAESEQPYALPTSTVSPFLSDDVNQSGAKGWAPITRVVIDDLTRRSAQRVKTSERFKEVREGLKKLEHNADQIKISELLDESTSDDDDDDDEAEKKKDELSPQAQEALDILADLVTTQKS